MLLIYNVLFLNRASKMQESDDEEAEFGDLTVRRTKSMGKLKTTTENHFKRYLESISSQHTSLYSIDVVDINAGALGMMFFPIIS